MYMGRTHADTMKTCTLWRTAQEKILQIHDEALTGHQKIIGLQFKATVKMQNEIGISKRDSKRLQKYFRAGD